MVGLCCKGNKKTQVTQADPTSEYGESGAPVRKQQQPYRDRGNPAKSQGWLHPRIDDGWAWIVMVAAFFMVLIVDGIAFTFGLLYSDLLERFGENRAKTALVGTVLTGVYGCSAPLPSLLSDKVGIRPVAVAGCVLAAAAFVASSFSTNLDMLVVLYGAVGGLGLSFMYLTSMVMVSLYFDKKRPLAYGVASCGSGVGMLVMPLLVTAFRDHLGWNGILRLEAGLLAGCVLCALLLRPLPKEDDNEALTLLAKQTRHMSEVDFRSEIEGKLPLWADVNGNAIEQIDVIVEETEDGGQDNQAFQHESDQSKPVSIDMVNIDSNKSEGEEDKMITGDEARSQSDQGDPSLQESDVLTTDEVTDKSSVASVSIHDEENISQYADDEESVLEMPVHISMERFPSNMSLHLQAPKDVFVTVPSGVAAGEDAAPEQNVIADDMNADIATADTNDDHIVIQDDHSEAQNLGFELLGSQELPSSWNVQLEAPKDLFIFEELSEKTPLQSDVEEASIHEEERRRGSIAKQLVAPEHDGQLDGSVDAATEEIIEDTQVDQCTDGITDNGQVTQTTETIADESQEVERPDVGQDTRNTDKTGGAEDSQLDQSSTSESTEYGPVTQRIDTIPEEYTDDQSAQSDNNHSLGTTILADPAYSGTEQTKPQRSVSFQQPSKDSPITVESVNDYFYKKHSLVGTNAFHKGTNSGGHQSSIGDVIDRSFSVFKSPMFICVTIHSIFASFGWYTVMVFLPDFAQQQGIGEDKASFLISIIGISNTVFRVLPGAMAYFFPKQMKPQVMWVAVTFVVGSVTCGLPHMTSYGTLSFAAVMCGLLLATDIALRTVVIEGAVGTEHLSIGFAFNCLATGLVILSAGPVCGTLYGLNDNYKIPFYVAAAAMFCSTATNIGALLFTRRQQQRAADAIRVTARRHRGSSAIWTHGSVVESLQMRSIAHRRRAIVAELRDGDATRHASLIAQIRGDVSGNDESTT